MIRTLRLSTFILVLSISISNSSIAEQTPMKCETGPLKKVYGNTNWLVYSCTDKKTVVIVSDTANHAMPFYFTFYIKDGSYNLSGEGTGDKNATSAAYKELSKLSESEIKVLIQEAENGK